MAPFSPEPSSLRSVMSRRTAHLIIMGAFGQGRLGHFGLQLRSLSVDGDQPCWSHVRDSAPVGSTIGAWFQGCMVIPAGPGGGVEKVSGEAPVWAVCPVDLIATSGPATDAPDEGSGLIL